MKIQIIKWEEYLHRKDMKSLTWFRVNNNIMQNHKFHKIKPEAGWFYICLLGFAAQKVSDTINLSDAYLHDITGCNVSKCLESLEERGLVRVCTDLHGNAANITEHNTTQHTQQNITEHTIETSNDVQIEYKNNIFELIDFWNNNAHKNLPRVMLKTFSKDRLNKLYKLFKKKQDLTFWKDLILIISNSKDFVLYEWRISFDEIFLERHYSRFLEGKFKKDSRITREDSVNPHLMNRIKDRKGGCF